MATAKTADHATALFLMAVADPDSFSKTFLLGAYGLRSDVRLSQHGSFAKGPPSVETDSSYTDSPTHRIS